MKRIITSILLLMFCGNALAEVYGFFGVSVAPAKLAVERIAEEYGTYKTQVIKENGHYRITRLNLSHVLPELKDRVEAIVYICNRDKVDYIVIQGINNVLIEKLARQMFDVYPQPYTKDRGGNYVSVKNWGVYTNPDGFYPLHIILNYNSKREIPFKPEAPHFDETVKGRPADFFGVPFGSCVDMKDEIYRRYHTSQTSVSYTKYDLYEGFIMQGLRLPGIGECNIFLNGTKKVSDINEDMGLCESVSIRTVGKAEVEQYKNVVKLLEENYAVELPIERTESRYRAKSIQTLPNRHSLIYVSYEERRDIWISFHFALEEQQ